MRPLAGLAIALLALTASAAPLAAASHRDTLVQAVGPAVLTTYDGQGQPVNVCDVPALLATLKLTSLGTRPLYALAPPSAGGPAEPAPCALVGPLSARDQLADTLTGSWDQGWTFTTFGPYDTFTLATGPYGDGKAIALHYLQAARPAGTPEVEIVGTVADVLAGA